MEPLLYIGRNVSWDTSSELGVGLRGEDRLFVCRLPKGPMHVRREIERERAREGEGTCAVLVCRLNGLLIQYKGWFRSAHEMTKSWMVHLAHTKRPPPPYRALGTALL